MKAFTPFVLAAVACAVSLGVASAGAQPPTDPPGFDRVHSNLTLGQGHAFGTFRLYYAGDAFDRLPLTTLNRRLDQHSDADIGDPHRRNFVTVKYGDCRPTSAGGCPYPLEIQVWPACERTLSMYTLAPDVDGPGPRKAVVLPHENLHLRGAPAAYFDSDPRLELYTGDVTVVLFGQSRGQLMAAAAKLRGLNNAVSPGEALPQPAPGAMEGRLECSGSS